MHVRKFDRYKNAQNNIDTNDARWLSIKESPAIIHYITYKYYTSQCWRTSWIHSTDSNINKYHSQFKSQLLPVYTRHCAAHTAQFRLTCSGAWTISCGGSQRNERRRFNLDEWVDVYRKCLSYIEKVWSLSAKRVIWVYSY